MSSRSTTIWPAATPNGWDGSTSSSGCRVGCIVHGLSDEERRQQYACDVTYGTNNELGFDYLRDNMKYHLEEMVQRGHHFAIVDEVDSILVDEARTPLIISGPVEDRSDLYNTLDGYIPKLAKDHYELDEKQRTVTLTEAGNEYLEALSEGGGDAAGDSLYDSENVTVVHHVTQALRAHTLFQRDRDYIVKDDQVIIIDEFTGRMMPGRRYSDGLHQALEAKEHVAIQPENRTLASITFQNYFRLYRKLAGMTGTAATEAEEFMDIYRLDVVEVPTNLPVMRTDEDDEVYRTLQEKTKSVIELISGLRKRNQPVLVGTTSIEKSESLSAHAEEDGHPAQCAECPLPRAGSAIIAQAGVAGTVTIATNMAGRGTDIQLGGNADMRTTTELADVSDPGERSRLSAAIRDEVARNKAVVIDAGGLFVIGTERHESRRIDNQLRGRSGRQGDPGRSRFFLSLEDDLMRIFGSERMDKMLQTLGLKEGEAIIHPWINKALEKAQQKVEARNFDIRKNLLKFDNVMNDQRKVIFEQRIDIMRGEEVSATVDDMRDEIINDLVATHIPATAYAEQWDAAGLRTRLREAVGLDLPVDEWATEEGIAEEEIHERIAKAANDRYSAKREKYGRDIMGQVEKAILLQTLDHLWREHLVVLEHLRQVIGLRGYGQRDPLNEYKTEGFNMFEQMIQRLREMVTGQLMRVEVAERPPEQLLPEENELPDMEGHHFDPLTGEDEMIEPKVVLGASRLDDGRNRAAGSAANPNDTASWGKVGRNERCPCGSGKKFKHCHGVFA